MTKTMRVTTEIHQEVMQVARDLGVTTAEALELMVRVGQSSPNSHSSTDSSVVHEHGRGRKAQDLIRGHDLLFSTSHVQEPSVSVHVPKPVSEVDFSEEPRGHWGDEPNGSLFEEAMGRLEARGTYGTWLASTARRGAAAWSGDPA